MRASFQPAWPGGPPGNRVTFRNAPAAAGNTRDGNLRIVCQPVSYA
jgi:hypothetical protein